LVAKRQTKNFPEVIEVIMPLKDGSTRGVISDNIRELTHAAKKRPRRQIIALALANARKSKRGKRKSGR
jgi:hypothetical protein